MWGQPQGYQAQGPPGPSNGYVPSFHNVEASTREQRLAARSKEGLEKERLRARGVAVVDNVIIPPSNAPAYADEYQRFGAAQSAALEHERRVKTMTQKEDVYERKRQEGYQRERERWQYQEQQAKQYEDHMENKRQQGQGGTARNASGTQYDIINLNYRPSAQGDALKQKDDATQYRTQMRTANLYSRQHAVTHNIITGQPLPFAPAQPPRN